MPLLPKPDYCQPCCGYRWDNCKGFSRVSGSGNVPLLLIGEGSGRTEVKRGEPFVGQAGQVLNKALRISGLSRNDYSVTNLIRCGIPGNLLIGQPYERPALDHCRKYLNDVVAERQPKLIVALGEVPLRELAVAKLSQAEARGYILDSIYPGVKLLPTFHPSRILRGDWHLFGVLIHDLQQAHRFVTHGIPDPLPTCYNLRPTADQLQRYLDRLLQSPQLPVSYDIETASILGEPEPEPWSQKRIIQIQFSSAAGEAIVIPWNDQYTDLIRLILATSNPKLTWNGRLSDDIALKAHGMMIGGESYDAMTMFSHLQPNFAGRDAADDEDKGVPARLLNLQAAVSFYFPTEGCWKGTVTAPGPGLGGWLALQYRLRYYGARDADLTWRIGTKLMDTLKQQGLWHGWYRFKYQLGLMLSRMSERGLPIDRKAQGELLEHIEATEQQLESELQQMIPAHLRPYKEYRGWPKDLREAVKTAGLYVKRCQPWEFPTFIEDCNYTLMPFEMETDEGEAYLERRLCKVFPFNPRSNKQVLAYIQWQVEQEAALVPTLSERRWFIPLHIDTKQPTTNKAGMEALIDATDDAALKQIEKCKRISKLKDYCHGKWEPDDDGRVHAEFRVGVTGTGQTTATNPPIQTYPKHFSKDDKWLEEIGRRIKSIIKAPPGHVMVETDMRGFHARMQAFLAEDVAYYRLANIDTHSFLAAHYVGVSDKDSLLQLDDAALSQRLVEIKKQYDYERNYLCKRVSFLNQYGGQAAKASTILRLPQMEVQRILDINREIFKPAFKDLPDRIERMLQRHPKLVTAFGFPRYFWDEDLNQALAFYVASPAHCVIQDAVLRLDERGALERFNAVNLMHDAVWWCPREEDAAECIAVAHEEFERASDVLINSLGAFTCAADAKMGYNMAELVDV